MIVHTKIFGTIDIEEDKILTFDHGMIGFESLKRFALLYDIENEKKHSVSWLQSLDEPQLAFPVIDPFLVVEDYRPELNENAIAQLGEVKEGAYNVLVTLTVPKDITKMSCNLRAPIVLHTDTRKGAQMITDTLEYPVKYFIYDKIKARKAEKGEF